MKEHQEARNAIRFLTQMLNVGMPKKYGFILITASQTKNEMGNNYLTVASSIKPKSAQEILIKTMEHIKTKSTEEITPNETDSF